MKVGDGVIIDGSKLGLNGGLLTGVVECVMPISGMVFIRLPRRVERDMIRWAFPLVFYQDEITSDILPNQGHWLGKEMR